MNWFVSREREIDSTRKSKRFQVETKWKQTHNSIESKRAEEMKRNEQKDRKQLRRRDIDSGPAESTNGLFNAWNGNGDCKRTRELFTCALLAAIYRLRHDTCT